MAAFRLDPPLVSGRHGCCAEAVQRPGEAGALGRGQRAVAEGSAVMAVGASTCSAAPARVLVKVATVPTEVRNRIERITPIRRDGDSRLERVPLPMLAKEEEFMLILPTERRSWRRREASDRAGGGRTKGRGQASR